MIDNLRRQASALSLAWAFTVAVLTPAVAEPAMLAIQPQADMTPDVLTPGDTERYRRIFSLQRDGRFAEADRLLASLDDTRLTGHVLYQRLMHPTAYRASFTELREWLDAYSDHPGAARIYRLAMKRMPSNARRPHAPDGAGDLSRGHPPDRTYSAPIRRPAAAARSVRAINARIERYLSRGHPSGALHYLNDAAIDRQLTAAETDIARTRIAAGYFLAGKDVEALSLAQLAAARSGGAAPLGDWYAGLAAWRLERHKTAFLHFKALADTQSPYASEEVKAAAAFWAARASIRIMRPEETVPLLEAAAASQHTFYGIIAATSLGRMPAFHWTLPRLNHSAWTAIKGNEGVLRAVALVEAGEAHRAEQELALVFGRSDGRIDKALLALAAALDLPATQLRVANALNSGGERFDAALYPLPRWTPAGGYRADPAFVAALIRQESRFNAFAKSYAGARGLMQIMPATASYVAGDRSLRWSGRGKLYDPEFNVTLGDTYVADLIGQLGADANLFYVAAAYNGGPGNLRKWLRNGSFGGDPLLFIESIPSRETRIFIERVLANYWIYRLRLGKETPALDAVAAGEWPLIAQNTAPDEDQAAP